MTAVPDPSDFVNSGSTPALVGTIARPNLTEHFWGYEVRSTPQGLSFAVLIRMACGVVGVAAIMTAVAVWFVPALDVLAQTTAGRIIASIILIGVAIKLAHIAARGTQIRVQVDTAAGEVREVVSGPFGTPVLLGRYGFDAVEKVELAASTQHPCHGQVLIHLHGGRVVPVGDGALIAINALRDRLANDCGLEGRSKARAVIWSGSIQR